MIPGPGLIAMRSVPPQDATFPMQIWEGTMTDGVEAVVISPSLWEQDVGEAFLNQWFQFQSTLNPTMLAKQGIQDQIAQLEFRAVVYGASANDTYTAGMSNAKLGADTLIMMFGGAVPILSLTTTTQDRPIGLQQNTRDSSVLPNHTVVLTREIIEKALASPALGPHSVAIRECSYRRASEPHPGHRARRRDCTQTGNHRGSFQGRGHDWNGWHSRATRGLPDVHPGGTDALSGQARRGIKVAFRSSAGEWIFSDRRRVSECITQALKPTTIASFACSSCGAFWGVVAMAVGVFAAAQLAWPALNFDVPWLTFSRIRPVHTLGVIFAFGGSALMGTCYYVVQRTGHTRLAFGRLALFTFWGWQAAMFLTVATIPFGITQSKEYAEPEWFIDLLIAVVWVSFGVVFFGTVARRRIQHIYVANWYYGAFIIAVGSAAHRQQPGDAGLAGSSRTRSTRVASMRWCSGGMAITQWRFSSPRAFSE